MTRCGVIRSDIISNSYQHGSNIRLANKPSIAVIAAPTQNINIRDNTRYDLDDTLPIQAYNRGGYQPRIIANPEHSTSFQRIRANMPSHPKFQTWTTPNNMMVRPEDHRLDQNMIARQNCPYARLSVQA